MLVADVGVAAPIAPLAETELPPEIVIEPVVDNEPIVIAPPVLPAISMLPLPAFSDVTVIAPGEMPEPMFRLIEPFAAEVSTNEPTPMTMLPALPPLSGAIAVGSFAVAVKTPFRVRPALRKMDSPACN